ncbi:hypothetical protein NKG05_11940 [Oerskovia sp. M15]
MTFDFKPIADALAARGRVVVRRAYADWSYFDEDRRSLTRHQVELIEMPQRMGHRARTPPTSRWSSTRSRWPSSASTSRPSSCARETATSRPWCTSCANSTSA